MVLGPAGAAAGTVVGATAGMGTIAGLGAMMGATTAGDGAAATIGAGARAVGGCSGSVPVGRVLPAGGGVVAAAGRHKQA